MENHKNTDDLHHSFIAKLSKRYGTYDVARNKFESTSNSTIARDLFYSDSQFSRLINNTASEGEFKRAVRNIDRLLELDHIKKSNPNQTNTISMVRPKRKVYFIVILFLVSIIAWLSYSIYNSVEKTKVVTNSSRYDMLKWGFDNNYIQPYTKLKELPADCYYPCYKYQGNWTLKNEYKIPFYREQNGFHYVAKEAIMYARCMDERDDLGESFEGYEYQKHEIWYDKREYPIDSFLTKGSNTKIRNSYNTSDLNKDENFVKIAFVHTFFRTEFEIDSSLIQRTGKALGRDIEFVDDKVLEKQLDNERQIQTIKDEIKAISLNRLEDYSKPISCDPSLAPNVDFNLITEGDEMSFNCHFNIGRFTVDYNKIYIFNDQYIQNDCR
ncbi:hypothetical protein V8G61_01680 [Gaetbulibacter sp. M240]|uniref:hypothetical protein n=1 Tax=Gaetbulibacter sp. M240 TaxID=3126511 RepID=UPI00374FD52A